SQREYYLSEQMKAIQKELGEEDSQGELDEMAEKIEKLGMSAEAKTKAEAELKRLKMMPPMSAEATVVRNYLDWLLELPWKKRSRVRRDLAAAEKILDEDHFGLEKVKERVLEHLAVLQLVRKLKGPILCFVGPPGVGKTSLGRSIARATHREFVRMSLGGVRDESEIRGHRRTYIGSMPGKVIQSMKKAGTRNPLILLDEIDKLGSDFRGDPSSALLEVLDPEQNHTFNDHYMEVDYDLSDVMFITTANSLNIPGPLLDRMEIIQISGYTEDEKTAIAQKYLLSKQMKNHGLKEQHFTIDKGAIVAIIRYYTREAGVRGLDRTLAKICRKVAKELVSSEFKECKKISASDLEELLGVKKYRFGLAEERDQIGVVTGLA
ncbi:MAG: AAA family ATPase, partial [Mariprofundaceae bacterium]